MSRYKEQGEKGQEKNQLEIAFFLFGKPQAAHLKPIDQKDRRDLGAAGAPGVARWNPMHGNAAGPKATAAATKASKAAEQKPPEKKPASKEGKTTKRSSSTTATDFFKRWRLCRDPLERSRLLLEHSPRLSKMLEGREAPGEVAAEVPTAVAAALDSSGAVLSKSSFNK